MIELLEIVLDHEREYFIVLDGLDECAEVQTKEAVDFLKNLLQSSHLHVKIFWSSRPSVISSLIGAFPTQQHVDVDSEKNQQLVAQDIRLYVRLTLEEWLDGDSPELQVNDPGLILEISECLEAKACGM